MTADVIVLGAGLAGVGAALRAARGGHKVVVVERSDRPGGIAGSFDLSGVFVDYGSHRLHPATDPSILAELRGLLGGDLQHRPRNGRILLDGRWIAFPLQAKDLVRRLPWTFTTAAARDAALAWTRSPHEDTFESAMLAGLGPTLCERFYFPYARKLWGLEPAEISAEQARRRVSAGTPARLLKRLLPGAKTGTYWYPRRGYGQIGTALAQAAGEAGAAFRWETAAERVHLERGGSMGVELADGTILEGRRVWSTIPLTRLALILDPPPPPNVLEAARSLSFRAMLLVYLVLGCGRYTPHDTHYLPESFTPVTRFSEPKNYRDGDDPNGRTVLCFEIPCNKTDRIWQANDAELGTTAQRALTIAGLPGAPVEEVAVRRLPAVYPIYHRGFEHALNTLTGWARAQPDLLTFGRQGLFAHDNAHHALAMAWAATDALQPSGGFDHAAWDAACARFAEHVVED